jgi:hypothetical protein
VLLSAGLHDNSFISCNKWWTIRCRFMILKWITNKHLLLR